MDSKNWRLPLGVDFLAVLAPMLYFTGYCYYWGFCQALGLDIRMMDISYDKMLLASWSAFLFAAGLSLFYVTIWNVSFVLGFPFVFVLELFRLLFRRFKRFKRTDRMERKVAKFSQKLFDLAFPVWYREELLKTDSSKITLSFALCAALGLSIYSFTMAEKQGIKAGKEAQDKASMVTLHLLNETLFQGKYISTIGNKIVLMTTSPEGVLTHIVVNQNEIKRWDFE